ncbi:MAG TPA: hypothetical protein VKE27_09505, partial [Candidatus Dormibacteraeota bacterium]|nr:hypothetical protein [Candidatus Dormibacteraeota bacterium]
MGFLGLEGEWKALFDRSGSENPFLSWEWISTWVKHFCGRQLRTVMVRSEGRVIAIAPFHLKRYLIGPGLHATALQLLGPKEVQHLFEIREILVERGKTEIALLAVLDHLEEVHGW